MEKRILFEVNIFRSFLMHLGIFVFIFVVGFVIDGWQVFSLNYIYRWRFFFNNQYIALIMVYGTIGYMTYLFLTSIIYRNDFLFMERGLLYFKGKKICRADEIDVNKTTKSRRFLFQLLDVYKKDGQRIGIPMTYATQVNDADFIDEEVELR